MKNNNNDLLNIFGARRSKDEKRINITLVRGEKEKNTVEYFTVSMDPDKKNGSSRVALVKDKKTGEEFAVLKIKMLKPFEDKKEQAEEPEQMEMPF